MWVERNGKKYRIREASAEGTVTLEGSFLTQKAAESRMYVLLGERVKGDYVDPRGGKTLLADFIELWWPSYESSLKPSARRTEGSRVRNHIVPMLGKVMLEDLLPLRILRWVNELACGEGPPLAMSGARRDRKPLSPKSVRNVHGILHKILSAAVGQKLIRINPAIGTAMPTRVRKEMKFLTPPEIGRLLAACPELWRPLVLLWVSTGLRYGEVLALRVSDVDLIAGTVRVVRTLHHGKGGDVYFTEPKSERSRRTVTIPQGVCVALAVLAAGKEGDELLVCMADGSPLTRTFRQNVWVKIRESAGFAGLRIHDLRHTHAAILISANVPLTAIQRRLGHSSIRVTSDLYGHLMPEVDEGILASVAAALPKIDLGENLGVTDVDSGRSREPRAA